MRPIGAVSVVEAMMRLSALLHHAIKTTNAAAVLAFNRGHWIGENGCHYILDWNWGEDRFTIRTGHGPETITVRCGFATGTIRSKFCATVAPTIPGVGENRFAVALWGQGLRGCGAWRRVPMGLVRWK
jgi:hypothetical protein